jgi:hypothetical protein
MLTIRVKDLHGDSIFQAARATYGPDAQRRNAATGVMVEFFDANDKPIDAPVCFGDVYVMNDNGKTVAVYNLGRA